MAGDGEQSSLETTVDEMLTTLTDLTAKVSDLATQTAALKPLLPLAKQLDGLPDKVTTLQAAAFEGSNQIAALSLVVLRLEKAQRGDKEPSEVDAAGGGCLRTNTPERRRVPYASLHLTGSAQLWFCRLELTTGTSSWHRFTQLVQQRFGPSMTDGLVGEMMLLRRDGIVDDYTDKFLALACRDAELTESQLVQMNTASLVNPLKTDIALRRPTSLDDAIMFARAYEQRMLLSASNPGHTWSIRSASRAASTPATASHTPSASAHESASSAAAGSGGTMSLTSTLPRRRLSPAEMSQRRAEGLCYNCDEKFVTGHRCKKLFVIEIVGFDDADTNPTAATISATDDTPGISLHAIIGVRARGCQTIKVLVSIGNMTGIVLLDSGSSHNFINVDMARRAGVPLQPCPHLAVTVTNGDRVASPVKALAQHIGISGEAFDIDFYALPLGDYDMVLGIQWLGTLGPVLWVVARHKLRFTRSGKRITWTGIDTTPGLASVSLMSHDGDLLDALLEEFDSLFTEPQGLPRNVTSATASASSQALEPSPTSAFSSLALLIRKRDDAMIKDKFPIPVVEELLDELRGARFFTKLDMRSGYHQVPMHPDNVDKTAFCTHQGLFEFLVMPFGLTNASVTFQAMMNDILLPYLRRFVLDHQLFLKRSKCAFGLPSVEYLGHVISERGVSVDEQKVEAILSWPIPSLAHAVRGFLGLAGYYRRFIRDYGDIAAPLTALLKKEGFRWNHDVERAFRTL
ncbi:uncharacterized protein LOC120689329 [Panicum virgatum]|uniref:uncharacterized protein LOC120689329 n=1 Tax=Panicum virgatum TaxID=38727 RepID=UPI0019D5E319|nr:uncharacterized protein LOC120689329 [Panicum virgatum]